MGKKHLPPLPIDIDNAPSPYTLLQTTNKQIQSRKRPRGNPEGSPTTSDVAVSPSVEGGLVTGSGGAAGGFPSAPVDDRSESGSLVDSDEFSTEGDDGNQYEDGSSTDDEEASDGDDMMLEEGEEMEGEEGGEEDDESGDSDAEDIQVDFEAVEMQRSDVEAVIHLLDRLIPDHLNEVDRDAFAESLLESPYTTLGRVADDADEQSQPSSSSPKHEDEPQRDVIGLVSVVDFARALKHKELSPAFGPLLKILQKPWSTLASGILPTDVLTSQVEGKSKSVLLATEFINNVPLELASRILAFTVEELETVLSGKKTLEGSEAVGAMPSCLYVVLAKTQRGANQSSEDSKKKKDDKKSGKGGSSSSPTAATVSIEQLVFWREECEILFQNRDVRVAVTVHRCRPQYEGQPESEVPLTLAFAVSSEGMQKALAEIRKRETIVPL